MKELTLTVIFLLLVLVAVASAFAQENYYEVAESSGVQYHIPVSRIIPESPAFITGSRAIEREIPTNLQNNFKASGIAAINPKRYNGTVTLNAIEDIAKPLGK